MARRLKLVTQGKYRLFKRYNLFTLTIGSALGGMIIGYGFDRWTVTTMVGALVLVLALQIVIARYLRRLQAAYEDQGYLEVSSDHIALLDKRGVLQQDWKVADLNRLSVEESLIYAHDDIRDIKAEWQGAQGVSRVGFEDANGKAHAFTFELTSHYDATQLGKLYDYWRESYSSVELMNALK